MLSDVFKDVDMDEMYSTIECEGVCVVVQKRTWEVGGSLTETWQMGYTFYRVVVHRVVVRSLRVVVWWW
jgi:hypothetical protein